MPLYQDTANALPRRFYELDSGERERAVIRMAFDLLQSFPGHNGENLADGARRASQASAKGGLEESKSVLRQYLADAIYDLDPEDSRVERPKGRLARYSLRSRAVKHLQSGATFIPVLSLAVALIIVPATLRSPAGLIATALVLFAVVLGYVGGYQELVGRLREEMQVREFARHLLEELRR